MLTNFLIFALIGVVAGFLAGLLGIGGGLVTVPSLHFTFLLLGFPMEKGMQIAIGTSLGAMVFTAAASARAHYLKNGVNWSLFRYLAPGVILGAFLGALIADSLPGRTLELIFGISISLVGVNFLFPEKKFESESKIEIHPLMHLAAGIVIGTTSTILGIGGGILSVPYLTFIRTPLRSAISTSAVLGFPIAFIGALSFLYLGLGEVTIEGSIGYLYVPAFISIAIVSSLLAPLGAKAAYAIPVNALRRAFGVILICVGLSMIF